MSDVRQEAERTCEWLSQLEANARTVNDDHGLPLAEKCVEAQRSVRALLALLASQQEEHARLKQFVAKADRMHDAEFAAREQAESALAAAQAEIVQLSAWKEAIVDALVVDWCLSEKNENDPKRAINDLLAWQAKIALDPAVSKEAHDLVAAKEAAEQEVERLKARVTTLEGMVSRR